MGFFSDLKEDLSQAVNDLMPGEEQDTAQDEEMMSLDEMLKNIDSIEISTDDLEDDDSESEDDEAEEAAEEETVDEVVEEAVTEETTEETVAEETVVVVEEFITEEAVAEEVATEASDEEWDLESMLANALTEEKNQVVEKTEENKGEEATMEMSTRTVSDETSVITAGMSITGDITSEGSLDLIGTVIGNIDILGKLNITGHINGNSKSAEIYAEGAKINGEIVSDGAVKIGASTVIVGNITATSAVIAGAVKGDIDVRGPVILDTSAIVMGNIKSKSVQINNGAVIEGMCSQCYADVSPTSFFEDYKMEMKKDKSK